MNKIKIFAHRGLVFEYPENTLASFEGALIKGYSLELDIHRTKDKKLVVIHDSNTLRLTRSDFEVTKTDFKFLRELDYGSHFNPKFSNQKIPLLEEVLDLFRKHNPIKQEIAIQIKDSNEKEIAKLVSSFLKKYDSKYSSFNLFKKVFVFDVTAEMGVTLKKLCPKLRIGLSVGENKNFPDFRYPTIYTLTDALKYDFCDIIWADEWEEGLYNEEFFNICKTNGKTVYVISPELHKSTDPKHPLSEQGYEKLWKKLKSWKYDGICTDYPDKFKKQS